MDKMPDLVLMPVRILVNLYLLKTLLVCDEKMHHAELMFKILGKIQLVGYHQCCFDWLSY